MTLGRLIASVWRYAAVACLTVTGLMGCASTPQIAAHPVAGEASASTSPQSTVPSVAPADLYITSPPQSVVRAPWWRWMQGRILYPVQETFDLSHLVRTVTGRPRPAMDLVQGYVADSSFFTNRAIASLTLEQMRWGPSQPSDLPVPPLVFEGVRPDAEGPGVFVVDRRGDHYVLTVDAPDYPELISGAEVVTSKLLHALGYNVLSCEIYQLNPREVQTHTAGSDLPRRLPESLAPMEALLAPQVDTEGRVRVAATKLPDESIIAGSFSLKTYQHYAALRGLRIADAWLNNIDAGELQTLMTWDGHIARGYVVSFGAALGAHVHRRGPKAPQDGWEQDGLRWRQRPYDVHEPIVSPAIGRLAARFDPHRWAPDQPNIAFDQMTEDEARWMAWRIATLTTEQLTAAVAAAQYSHADDVAVLVRVLQQRQAIVRDTYLQGASQPSP